MLKLEVIIINYQLISPINSNFSTIEQILVNRGFNFKDIQHYLHTDDNDILPPETIMNIDDGIKMLINHISQNDKVLVVADSDCDGYTSAAVLLNYLYCLFPGFV